MADAEIPPQGDAAPEPGWVAPALAREFPGLTLATTTVDAGGGRSPAALKERLKDLSDRFGGQQAIVLRQRPIPWAYRVFFRHIALDPDETPTPAEQVSLDRMRDGRYRSRNRVEDALTIAIAEVGVAVQAVDAAKIEGRLGLRLSEETETLEGRATPLEQGTIVLVDEARVLGLLFGPPAESVTPTRSTERTTLIAIGVKGVPEVALEEGLWVAASALLA
ncbi:hypothetical protein BH20ACT15_BH20ACT15_15850 [soil metagenome]